MIAIISRNAAAKPNSGEAIIGMTILSTITSHFTNDRVAGPAVRDRRADQAADEGVGGRRGQPEVPGEQVPGDRTEEPGHHDDQPGRAVRRADDAR